LPRRGRSRARSAHPVGTGPGCASRTFALEVFAGWRCGGRLKGVGVREGGPRGAGDGGAPGLAHGRCEVGGPGTRATPGCGVLRLKRRPQAGGSCHAPEGSAAWAGVCPKGAPAACPPAGSIARAAPSAALRGPSSPSLPLNWAPHPSDARLGLTGRRGALSDPTRRSSSSGGGRRRRGCRRLRGASRAPDGNARSFRGDGGKSHDLSSSPSRPGCCKPAPPLGARIRPDSRVFWLEAGRLSGNERAPTPAAASARSPGHAGPAGWW